MNKISLRNLSFNGEIHNLRRKTIINSQLKNFDFDFHFGKSYILSSKPTKGSWAISWIIGGAVQEQDGTVQLDNKDLLEKDIVKSPNYYVAFLTELKESDIERSEYLFLENKLAFLTTEVAENKYAVSKLINILMGLSVLVLIFAVFRLWRNKKQVTIIGLSKQEKNIQGLILQGKSNKEIANELFISLSTVKTHITNIYGKLQVSSRQELFQKIEN